MPEKFEPIQVVDTGTKIKEFQVDFSEQSLGEVGKENFRLKNYLDNTKDQVQARLDSFKKSALKEYTGPLTWDNEKAVNQAMDDFAAEMNKLLEGYSSEILAIAKKYEKLADQDILAHYQKVAEEGNPVLREKMILLETNNNVETIIKAAAARAEGKGVPAPQPASNPRAEALKAAGIENPDDYLTHRTLTGKPGTGGDFFGGDNSAAARAARGE